VVKCAEIGKIVGEKCRLRWFGHTGGVGCEVDINQMKCCKAMEVDRARQRGSPRKT